MRAKFPYEMAPGVFGVISIDLNVPARDRLVLENKGMGKQEVENLIGQTFQQILDVLGLNTAEGV